MGKLNIAHHKSYHPYRLDNIEKVRRDEEEARQKEEKEEGRMMFADSEARIDMLRQRAGLKGNTIKDDSGHNTITGNSASSSLSKSTGHINFFEDLEQQAALISARASKKSAPAETEKGVPLAPSAKDLKPWYSERKDEREKEPEGSDERRMRDLAFKSMNDPLTSITHRLASRSSAQKSLRKSQPPSLPSSSLNEVDARLSRESSERQRALELIKRKKREMQGSETPSTVHGGLDDRNAAYGDVFNRREVEEAHRGRERRWGEDDRRRRRW